MDKPLVAAYLGETRAVDGWLEPIDALALAMFDEIQKREKIEGNLFEIGVHHGKSAILLARMARRDESLGVCDPAISRDSFLANLRRFSTLPVEQLSIFDKRSASLTVDETTNRCRLFHVDGGHEPEDIFLDLLTADRALVADGLLAVDDLFNPNWPGVNEGFYNFYADHPDVFVPILIGANKVFFARVDAAPRYEKYWTEEGPFREMFATVRFELRRWLGRQVLTAIRTTEPKLGTARPRTLRQRLFGRR